MLRTIAMSFYLILILVAGSCSKNTTTPPPPDTSVDTTSHNFVWQIDTLGPLTTSLRDVAFSSDDEALAVGRIQFIDSNNVNNSYGLARWKNKKWSFLSLNVSANQSVLDINQLLILENDQWFAAGSIYNWSGSGFAQLSWLRDIYTPDLSLALWAENPTSIYSVGSEGLMLHFREGEWHELNRITNIRLTDISGDTATNSIWACGRRSTGGASILLQGSATSWDVFWKQSEINSDYFAGELSSLWHSGNDSLIIVGGRQIYWQDAGGVSPPRKESLELEAFPWKVRGQAKNDIFVVGQRGMVWHFNGKTWRNYPELQNPNHEFASVAIRGNNVIIVGQDFSQGVQRLIIVSGVREN